MMYMQSLILKGCFHVYLLKVESFSVIIENHLRGDRCAGFCDIANGLILVQYVTYTSVMWKLEASSAQTLRIDFTLK